MRNQFFENRRSENAKNYRSFLYSNSNGQEQQQQPTESSSSSGDLLGDFSDLNLKSGGGAAVTGATNNVEFDQILDLSSEPPNNGQTTAESPLVGGDSTAAMAASAASARADLVRVRVERALMVAAGSLRPNEMRRRWKREKRHPPLSAAERREKSGKIGAGTDARHGGTAENGPRGGAAVLGGVSEDIWPFTRGKRPQRGPGRTERANGVSRGESPVGNGCGRWRGGCRRSGLRNPAGSEVGSMIFFGSSSSLDSRSTLGS